MEFKLQSDTLLALLPCWVEAQTNLSKGIVKDKAGFNFKYATLEAMQEFGEPILNESGLALNMARFPHEGHFYLQTRIYHVKSGEFFASYGYLYPLALTSIEQKAQGNLGGILSYQARYDLRTILCLPCKSEDADADNTDKPAQQSGYPEPGGDCITGEQQDELFAEGGFSKKNVQTLCVEMKSKNLINIAHSKYIPAKYFAAAMNKIREIKENNGN